MPPRAFGFPVLLLSLFLSFVPSVSRAAMSAGDIRYCDQTLEQFRQMAMSTSGTMAEKQRVFAHIQKNLFTLPQCKNHPQAKARIAEAEAMMRGESGDSAKKKGTGGKTVKAKRHHVPEAVATKCVSLIKSAKGIDQIYGGFKNSCSFAVMYAYCVYRPKKGSWTDGMDCEKNKVSSGFLIDPNGTDGNHTSGGQRVHWVACRWGRTKNSYEGIDPKDVKWDAGRKQITFRCGE